MCRGTTWLELAARVTPVAVHRGRGARPFDGRWNDRSNGRNSGRNNDRNNDRSSGRNDDKCNGRRRQMFGGEEHPAEEELIDKTIELVSS